jgi:cytochrome c biogenesis protein CcmG/thiol:disulfide interchange protein DsbE
MRVSLKTRYHYRAHAAKLILSVVFMALSVGCDRDNRPQQIDKVAPTFALDDGLRTVNLAQFRGRVVVLNFWASWCAPCIEEMPSLELIQSELPQIQILAVASDEDFTDYQSYLANHPVKLLTVFDKNQTSNALYGSFRFPETYIIDKKGFIRQKLVGPQDFTSPDMIKFLKKLAA